MSPARRLELAFQAYQFALDIVRLTERRAHPDLSPQELNWGITRRMQGGQSLGRSAFRKSRCCRSKLHREQGGSEAR
jgi:hypothetical protein